MVGLKRWLFRDDNRKCFDSEKLAMFMDDVNSHSVAIKGGNVFAITYALLGNVNKKLFYKYRICAVQVQLLIDSTLLFL